MAERTEEKNTKEKQNSAGIYGGYYFSETEDGSGMGFRGEYDTPETDGEEEQTVRNLFDDEETAEEPKKKRMITRAEFERRLAEKRRSRRKKRVVFLTAMSVFVVVLVLLILLGPRLVSSIMRRAGVKIDMQYVPVTSDVQYTGSGSASVTYGDGCLFVLDNGVAACHDMNGVFLWDYDLKDVVTPAVLNFRDCVIVYDTEGTVACALGKSGVLWEKQFAGDIDGVFYNPVAGIAAVVYDRDDEMYKSAVDVFSKNEGGGVKDLFTKNYTSQYVVSAAVSDDGKSLAVSGISAENGDVTGIISLVSVRTGENYYTKYIDSSVYPYVGFVNNTVLAAAGTDELLYVKNLTSVESVSQPENTSSIRKGSGTERLLCAGVPAGNLCVAVFGSGDGNSVACFRNETGAAVKDAAFDNSIRGITAYGAHLVLFTDTEVFLTDTAGKILGKCDSFSDIVNVVMMDETHMLVSHARGVSIVEFSEKS